MLPWHHAANSVHTKRPVIGSPYRCVISNIQSKVHEKFADRHLHLHHRKPHSDTVSRSNTKRLEYNWINFVCIFHSGNAQNVFTHKTFLFCKALTSKLYFQKYGLGCMISYIVQHSCHWHQKDFFLTRGQY